MVNSVYYLGGDFNYYLGCCILFYYLVTTYGNINRTLFKQSSMTSTDYSDKLRVKYKLTILDLTIQYQNALLDPSKHNIMLKKNV
jgi:hypothetical protein